MKTRLLCMPTLCADIFDATGEILPGGEALNLACIACRYDHMDVALLGAIGEDGPGQAILREIDARPIDRTNVHVIEGGATATHRIYHTPEGDRYFKPDSWQGGVFAAYRLTETVVRWAIRILGFVLLYLLFTLLKNALHCTVKLPVIGWVDKLGGAVLGAAECAAVLLITGVLLKFFDIFRFSKIL